MRLSLLFVLLLSAVQLQAQDVPYVLHDNFKFEMDYDFKTKPPPDQNKVNLVEETRYAANLLPFVTVNFTFSGLPESAFRVRVYDGGGNIVMSRKLKKIDALSFDLGFSDDLKDRVKPHSYYIYLENKDKVRLSKIKIFVEESGDFYLNDELYGRI